ncbi:MAG: hypothetical protein LWY06_14195 [Firmicutes bacterium]|nr:hypothetical protein [Bacillota bacterium]
MGYNELYFYGGIIGTIVCLLFKLKNYKFSKECRFSWIYHGTSLIIAATVIYFILTKAYPVTILFLIIAFDLCLIFLYAEKEKILLEMAFTLAVYAFVIGNVPSITRHFPYQIVFALIQCFGLYAVFTKKDERLNQSLLSEKNKK